jgi:UDP-N-acetylmuramyl tripeptide synthase
VNRSTQVLLEPSPLADALGGELVVGVLGDVNVENALAAALATHAIGVTPAHIARGLADFKGVTGRFERVWTNPLVVVDYAHTADALAATLALARKLVAPEGRVIVAFGCGGEADAGKRPEMGRVAVESPPPSFYERQSAERRSSIHHSPNPRRSSPRHEFPDFPGEGSPTHVRTTKGRSVNLAASSPTDSAPSSSRLRV